MKSETTVQDDSPASGASDGPGSLEREPNANHRDVDTPRSPWDSKPSLLALVTRCVTLDASDLHIAAGVPPHFRVHGVLAPEPNAPVLSAEQTAALGAELATAAGHTALANIGSLDGAFSAADGTRFRFNIFRRQGQISIALRRLEDTFRSLAELGLSNELYELCDLPDGLVIVAGPTGAGKSTTLATLLDRINRTRRCHMVTIEDPIEYLHAPIQSLVNQRQVGADAESFNEALVASLRQDPDVILVGEIRDLATIRTAITAAETGHLVFTTVHAGDCVGTIERLVSVFPADEQAGIRRQLSMVLRAIIAQHLLICDGPLPRSDASRSDAQRADRTGEPNGNGKLERRSRVVTSEVLISNPAVANLIATGKSSQIYSAMEAGGHLGMQTLEEDLARLWASNYISESTALAMARNPGVLRDRYQVLRQSGGATNHRARGVLR
ncbi:MAG TPA: ATPase, T2SS/T4P/T4SS family [Pirellulales bacterium]|jgi:twitching motility protein PilT|nr:ATPase, T2SS/T4P/T4SS family [Pirellulales bacterium]